MTRVHDVYLTYLDRFVYRTGDFKEDDNEPQKENAKNEYTEEKAANDGDEGHTDDAKSKTINEKADDDEEKNNKGGMPTTQ